jgi:hypothetical protein
LLIFLLAADAGLPGRLAAAFFFFFFGFLSPVAPLLPPPSTAAAIVLGGAARHAQREAAAERHLLLVAAARRVGAGARALLVVVVAGVVGRARRRQRRRHVAVGGRLLVGGVGGVGGGGGGAAAALVDADHLLAGLVDEALEARHAHEDARLVGDELVERALLDDDALLDHRDHVGVADRREAVRNDDGGAAAHHLLERLLHDRLAARVERRRRLVEQNDFRIAHKGARDRHALLLAARQLRALGADDGVVAVRERRDEVVAVGGARRRLDLRARHRLLAALGERDAVVGRQHGAERDVLGDRAREQHRLLADEADLRAPPVDVERRERHAVDRDLAAERRVEALEQADHGALAAARLADERHGGARLDFEREAAQHRHVGARRVDKVHVAHDDAALQLVGADRHAGRRRRQRVLVVLLVAARHRRCRRGVGGGRQRVALRLALDRAVDDVGGAAARRDGGERRRHLAEREGTENDGEQHREHFAAVVAVVDDLLEHAGVGEADRLGHWRAGGERAVDERAVGEDRHKIEQRRAVGGRQRVVARVDEAERGAERLRLAVVDRVGVGALGAVPERERVRRENQKHRQAEAGAVDQALADAGAARVGELALVLARLALLGAKRRHCANAGDRLERDGARLGVRLLALRGEAGEEVHHDGAGDGERRHGAEQHQREQPALVEAEREAGEELREELDGVAKLVRDRVLDHNDVARDARVDLVGALAVEPRHLLPQHRRACSAAGCGASAARRRASSTSSAPSW